MSVDTPNCINSYYFLDVFKIASGAKDRARETAKMTLLQKAKAWLLCLTYLILMCSGRVHPTPPRYLRCWGNMLFGGWPQARVPYVYTSFIWLTDSPGRKALATIMQDYSCGWGAQSLLQALPSAIHNSLLNQFKPKPKPSRFAGSPMPNARASQRRQAKLFKPRPKSS